MNLATIAIIIFVLFFCSAAWAGPFQPRSKIVPSSSNTPSPQINASDPGSKSFSTRLMEGGIDYYLTGTDSDYLNPEQQQQTSQSIRRTNFFGDGTGTGTGNSNSSGGRNKTRRNTTKTVAAFHLPKTDNPVADPSMAFGNEPPRQQQQQRTSSSSSPRSPPSSSSSSSSNMPSPQWFKASDPDSKSFTENQIEDAIQYCRQTNYVFQPPKTDNPATDPSMFFPTEAFLQDQAVPASQQQRPQTASSSHSAGGRKNGQLNSRKKVDGRLPKNFLSDSAGGDRT
uniref:Uncharacterized protein n=1 Tax=Globodera rostochiensis TaxID=31243 RepID=A0A914HJS1_GLORO